MANIQDIYPLSPLQQGMLFHASERPSTSLYVEQLSVTLSGPLDWDRLQQAWEEVCGRHDVLRTQFVWEKVKTPLQVVLKHVPLEVNLVEAKGWDAEALKRFAEGELSAGLNLASAPLMRVAVVRTASDAAVMLWTHHHILLDGWSAALVLNEVARVHNARVANRSEQLPNPVRYRDYIHWLLNRDPREERTFWQQHLEGFAFPTPLPALSDREGHAMAARGAGHAELVVGEDGVELLTRFSRSAHVTMNTVVQAAWSLLLARYSGTKDVLFGMTHSGRPDTLAGAEQCVGLFINTVPLRVQVDGSGVLVRWLQELQQLAADATAHGWCSLPELAALSDMAPGTSLFKSLLVFENYPTGELGQEQDGVGLCVTGVHALERTGYPLTLSAGVRGSMVLRASYEPGHYTEGAARHLLDELRDTMLRMAAGGQDTVQDILRIGAAERAQVLARARCMVFYERETHLGRRLSEVAQRRGDAVALRWHGETRTYREMEALSNRVARWLLGRGVRQEQAVGLVGPTSSDWVAVMLGVVKAGAMYVPLNEEDPAERLERLVGMAQMRDVLVVGANVGTLLEGSGVAVHRWEQVRAEINQHGAEPISVGCGGDQALYLMFTSGSTGTPKGVTISHRGVWRLVSHADYVRLDEATVTLHTSPTTFDGSTFELWGTLLNGGCLVVPSERNPSLRDFAAHIAESGVNLLWLTAGLFQQFVRYELGALAQVDQVMAGGDVVPPDAVRGLLAASGKFFVNGYGPTECTTFACCHRIDSGETVGSDVPIGSAISNTEAYVLSADLELVPLGAVGQLFLGGDGLARGYLGQPELTAVRFVPNPYGEAGTRLYRTGDWVRLDAAGTLHFVGRRDRQVKVRGFRIELEEVERLLGTLPGVQQGAVLVRGQGAGKRLVGYVAGDVTVEQVLDSSRSSLPGHLQPSQFVVLSALPLTRNGKVDRSRLPEPRTSQVTAAAAPQGEIEQGLAEVWAQVLGGSLPGRHDDFFALGGHSLSAIQVASRLRLAMGLELPLRVLFDERTVEKVATWLRLHGRELPPLPELRMVDRRMPTPVSSTQKRLWFLQQYEPESGQYNTYGVLRLRGQLDVAGLRWSLSEILERHEVLRTRFFLQEGEPVQQVVPAELSWRLVERAEISDSLEALLVDEALRPFDLEQGPLMRVLLVAEAVDNHVLMLSVHHIVADGWSMSVLMRELSRLYSAYLAGERASPLTPLRFQYMDYALWHRSLLESQQDRDLAYWRSQLAGVPEVISLPTDRPRPARRSGVGSAHLFVMSGELLEGLRRLAESDEATLFTVLLSSLAALLARLGAQDDVVIGTPVATRVLPETEALMGPFINTLAMRVRYLPRQTFRQHLRATREVALQAYAHQHAPFERLVDELVSSRSTAHAPLVQVLLTLQAESGENLSLPGLSVEPVSMDHAHVDMDLMFSCTQSTAGLAVRVQYSTDIFDAETIELLCLRWQRLLEQVVEEPRTALGRHELLVPAELELLDRWASRPSASQQAAALFVERWRQAAVIHAERMAVEDRQRTYTYDELWRLAEQLAVELLRRGAGRGARVAVYMERSVDMVRSLLAVLSAGAAYVPMDMSTPPSRLAYMLNDAQPALVLCSDASYQAVMALGLDTEVLLLSVVDAQADRSKARGLEGPGPVGREAPAYLIYTSGSTGRPKGVEISHCALSAMLAGADQTLGGTCADRVLALSSISFDISVTEILWPLTLGASVFVVADGVARDGEAALQIFRDWQPTLAQATPTGWRLLLVAGLGAMPDLRALSIGEALDPTLALALRERLREVWNLYGPTENTVFVTAYPIDSADRNRVPLGSPIPGTSLQLVDATGQNVPAGTPAEMCIGGLGVAMGYAGRPELTAERFLPDPWGEPGSRLYRTGDLVRYDRQGNIDYLGRMDTQLKLRGYRIELGEIESVLEAHPRVERAGVTVQEDQIVAFVLAQGADDDLESKLLSHLRKELPGYMVPGALRRVQELPWTTSGKLDRKRLPKVVWERPSEALVAPEGLVEQTLRDVWCEVLRRSELGVTDNFFALGGDSLASVRVRVAALRQGLRFSIKQLFENPTVRQLARVTTPFVDDRGCSGPAALLHPQDQSALPRHAVDAAPLSALQLGMIFHAQQSDALQVYHNVTGLRMRLAFSRERWDRAWRIVIARQPALRVSMHVGGYSEPLQVLHAHASVPMIIDDLRQLGPHEAEASIGAALAEERKREFDLSEPPLFRVRVLQLADDEIYFIHTEHHALLDGMSVAILLREFFAVYAQLLNGTDTVAGEAQPWLMPEFVALEREVQNSETARQTWLERLRHSVGPVVRLDKVTDASTGMAVRAWPLPATLISGLQRASRLAEAPLKTVFLTAYVRLLSAMAMRRRICTGVVVDGRPETEAGNGAVGMFLNTIPLPVHVAPSKWIGLIRKVFEAERAILAYRRMPIRDLRRLSGENELFDTIFNFTHFHVLDVSEGVGEGAILRVDSYSELEMPLGVSIEVAPDAQSGAVRWYHSMDQVQPEELEAIGERYMAMLARIADAPESAHDDPRMLAPVAKWLPARAGEGDPGSVPYETPLARIAAHATRDPHATALVDHERTLSFAQLMMWAEQVASALGSRRVRSEVPVAVYLERSAVMVATMLGVWRAGLTYVPIATNCPLPRVELMLDRGIRTVLTTGKLGEALRTLDVELVYVDELQVPDRGLAVEAGLEGRLGAEVAEPDELAYMIFTSGSTGTPKAVGVTHRSLAGLMECQQQFDLRPQDRVLMLASIGFDASIFEAMLALGSGAAAVPAGEDLSVEQLVALMRERRVTIMTITPSLLLALPADELPDLRLIISAGEACPQSLVDRWTTKSRKVINGYGPTETTVAALYERCEPGRKPGIGLALHTADVYLVDAYLEAALSGIAGELLVGGPCLARGYIGSPERTAERFIPNPYGTGGSRLYRTGDLARVRPDGRLEYVGRLDQQRKVRGHRIELAEVEHHLDALPGVDRSAAMVRTTAEGGTQLVAYAVLDAESPTPLGLRSQLLATLPGYMVPTVIVPVAELPTTVHGKVDFAALPGPGVLGTRTPHGEQPRAGVEATLAQVWESVLGKADIRREESFFDLGGDSISAMQIATKAAELGVQIGVRALMEQGTIARLAPLALVGGTAIQGEQGELTGPVSLSPIQRWFFEQPLAVPHHWNQSLMLEVKQQVDGDTVRRAWEQLYWFHDALRLRFQRLKGEVRAHYSELLDLPFQQVDLSALPEAEQARRITEHAGEVQASLNFERGPLCRLVHYVAGPTRSDHLLLSVHHLGTDMVSLQILVAHLERLLRGEGLPPKGISYRQWAEELRKQGEGLGELGPGFAGLLEWSDRKLGSMLDRAGQGAAEMRQRIQMLGPEVTAAITLDAARSYRATTVELLLSAVLRALGSYADSPNVGVDVEHHGRTTVAGLEVTKTVGWFTELRPVRAEAAAGTGFIDVLHQVKPLWRAAERGVSFGTACLGSGERARRLRGLPAAEVSLNFLGHIEALKVGQQLLSVSALSPGPNLAPENAPVYPVALTVSISDQCLYLVLDYDTQHLGDDRAVDFLGSICVEIKHLVRAAEGRESIALHPTDFPHCDLKLNALSRLVHRQAGDIEDIYTLSPLQEGILFHCLQKPDPALYVTQVSFELPVGLDPEQMEKAWSRVVAARPILRTFFVWHEDPAPVQVVVRNGVAPFRLENWPDGMSAEETVERTSLLLERERHAGFDLSRPNLARLVFISGGSAGRDRLVLTQHHILLDGWSMSLLIQDLFTAYRGEAGEASLATRRPFVDYIAWLRTRPDGEAESYWRELLSGVDGPTPLPATRRIGVEADFGGVYDFALDREATLALQGLARQVGVTLNVVVSGAWALLLSRHARVGDVVFGSIVSGRPPSLQSADGMLGMFINALPSRVRMKARAAVGDWLRDLHRQQNRSREFEQTPLMRVQEWTVGAGQRLFDSLIVYENYPGGVPVHPEAGTAPADEGEQTGGVLAFERTNYPLTLFVGPDDTLKLRFGYDRVAFAEDDIEQLAEHFLAGLRDLGRGRDKQLGELPGLGCSGAAPWAKQPRPLAESLESRRPQTLVECVAAWARTEGARAAVRDGQGTLLTYAQLSERVDSLATVLSQKVGFPGARVAVCVDRSADLVASLLAILKAGCAYVPLDPSWPLERLNYVLADSRTECAVVSDRFSSLFDSAHLELIRVEAGTERLWNAAQDTFPGVDMDAIAYVMYTSGSTGQPKGVEISHRSLMSFLMSMTERPGLGGDDVMVASTSPIFDIAALELFGPLLVGAEVAVASEQVVAEPRALVKWAHDCRATVMQATPSRWELLVEAGFRDPGLRVLCGGEVLTARLAALLNEGRCKELWNMYGPTEATIWCMAGPVPAGTTEVVLGEPVADARLSIVDMASNPVPRGMAGEMVIGGTLLAQGYLGRPDLTAERFVPDPFSPRPGERMYRTGDLVLNDSRGELRFLGRLDHQVKVGGHRIELEEVEAALLTHASVTDAVVLVREQTLIAFVTLRGDELSVAALKDLAARRLPRYMIPAQFVVVPKLPLTASGKVDRRALARLKRQTAQGVRAASRASPVGGPLEQSLRRLWCEVLGVDHVGAEDDFFALGGNSLASLRLALKIEEELNLPMSVTDVFLARTVGEMADLLVRGQQEVELPLVRIQPGSQEGHAPLYCIHPVDGHVLPYFALARALGPKQAVYGLQAFSRDGTPYGRSVRALAKHYTASMLAHRPAGPFRLLGWSFGGTVAYEVACCLTKFGADVEQLVLVDVEADSRGADTPEEIRAELKRELAERAPDIEGQTEAATEVADLLTDWLHSMRRYRPKAFPGLLDLVVSRERLTADRQTEPTLGWRRYAIGTRVTLAEASHAEMFSARGVVAVVRATTASYSCEAVGERFSRSPE